MTDYQATTIIAGLGNPLPTSVINRMMNNDAYFRTPPQYAYTRSLVAANYTIASGTMVDIDATNLFTTIVTTGNPMLAILAGGKIGLNALGQFIFDLNVDGVSLSTLSGLGVYQFASAAEFKPLMLVIPVLNLAAGSHTFRWQAKLATAATGTIYSANLIQTLIREM
jgi:hypothetical protein